MIKFLKLISIAAFLTACGNASENVNDFFRTDVVVTVEFRTNAKDYCSSALNREVDACFIDGKVIMPNPCDFERQSYAKLLCHENCHVVQYINGLPVIEETCNERQ